MSQYNYNSSLGSATATAGPIFGGIVGAPVATAASLAGGIGGGMAVDYGMKFATGKSWEENMSDWTGMDEGTARWTNPGI